MQHDTIEAAIGRGERLEELIEKSEDLSASSKMFYKVSLLSPCLSVLCGGASAIQG